MVGMLCKVAGDVSFRRLWLIFAHHRFVRPLRHHVVLLNIYIVKRNQDQINCQITPVPEQ